MKEYVAMPIHKLISPSMRFEIRKAIAWLRDVCGRACFWRWEMVRFKLQKDSLYDVLYVGRKNQREFVQVLMGANPEEVDRQPELKKSSRTVLISEVPVPGALCVPRSLSAVVPLGRSVDEITARYNTELRRNLRKNRLRYRMRQAVNDGEIASADREMLQPRFNGWQKMPVVSTWYCWRTRWSHATLGA
jgi:hypothetical protein